MSDYYSIGDAAKKLHAKMAVQLAGPLQSFLPSAWIDAAVDSLGRRVYASAFSPSGDAVGVHRPSP
jgi:hypothetical protein